MSLEKMSLLIVNNNMEIGGIQRSLVNFLWATHERYDITLFLFSASGPLLEQIPADVRIETGNRLLRLLGMSLGQSKCLGWFYYGLRLLFSAWTKVFDNRLPIGLIVASSRRSREFDWGISFMQPSDKKILYGGCNTYVLKRVRAGKKAAFVHCDFANYEGNQAQNRKQYASFDRIFLVSESCRASFLSIMPALQDRCHVVYNVLNCDEIRSKAAADSVIYDPRAIHFITVARLSPEKGILRGLRIFHRYMTQTKANQAVCWHILGDGMERSQCQSYITSHGLDKYVVLHGQTDNPYRYMANADFLFHPSYHEAAPMVFMEAACLRLPVLTTQTCSAMEMVASADAGWVCQNSDQGIYDALKRLLDHPQIAHDQRDKIQIMTDTEQTRKAFAAAVSLS